MPAGAWVSRKIWLSVVNEGGADAVAMADILHYKRAEIGDIRAIAENAGLGVRHYEYT